MSRPRSPGTLAVDRISPLHQPAVQPIQVAMVSKGHARETAMASVFPADWRNVARRLLVLTLLVFAVTARVEVVSFALHKFGSGAPVPRTTYLPRFTEIAAAEGRAYRDFPA